MFCMASPELLRACFCCVVSLPTLDTQTPEVLWSSFTKIFFDSNVIVQRYSNIRVYVLNKITFLFSGIFSL